MNLTTHQYGIQKNNPIQHITVQRALNYKLIVMLQLMENGGSGFRNRLSISRLKK